MNQTSLMKKEKSDQNEYTTVRVPKAFMEGMVDVLVNEKSFGFVSRADVVKAAVRNLYQIMIKKEPVEV